MLSGLMDLFSNKSSSYAYASQKLFWQFFHACCKKSFADGKNSINC